MRSKVTHSPIELVMARSAHALIVVHVSVVFCETSPLKTLRFGRTALFAHGRCSTNCGNAKMECGVSCIASFPRIVFFSSLISLYSRSSLNPMVFHQPPNYLLSDMKFVRHFGLAHAIDVKTLDGSNEIRIVLFFRAWFSLVNSLWHDAAFSMALP